MEAYWAKNDSAQLIYSLSTLYRPGENDAPYHAVQIPGNFKGDAGVASFDSRIDASSKIQSDFYAIREGGGETLFLLHGSKSALLIGTGSGWAGLAAFVHSLIGELPMDVAILDRDPQQSGGLAQLNARRIYNHAGQLLVLESASFQSDGVANLSLLSSADRLLFAGNALEKQMAQPRGMTLISKPEEDQAARPAWMARMSGRFDLVYLASNARWYSNPKDLEDWLKARAKPLL